MGVKLIKRKLKKLKKKLYGVKTFLNDQLFYIKDGYQNYRHFGVETIKGCILLLSLLLCSFISPKLHDAYIESKVGSNVVFLRSPKGASIQGSATGFEVQAPSGKIYTLTNAHVCGLAKDGLIMAEEKQNSKRFIPLRVLEVYDENDLCLVEGLTGYSGLQLADSIEVGQTGIAIGYPLGEELNISSGRIKGFGNVQLLDQDPICDGPHKRKINVETLFGLMDLCEITRYAAATDLLIYPGNSGSPLVNIYGNVIGVIFASNNRTAWGSAVPLKDVQEFLKAY